MPKQRAIISVTDKKDIEKFGRLSRLGWEIVSTGGTAETLKTAGIPITPVEAVTHFPEMMDGRLKTLHPNIFGGILADRQKEEHLRVAAKHHIDLIGLVVVNLYNFYDNPGIENIDIGGPSLLRAAAKNAASVAAVCDIADYDRVIGAIEEDRMLQALRSELALKVFEIMARYELAIATWLSARQAHPGAVWPYTEQSAASAH